VADAANGATSVYSYTPLPFKKGAMNANCSVEWDGKNIVFGPDDIWQHDGNTEKSICDGRVRDFIFNSINLSKATVCFVKLNPRQNEIIFAYVSGDQLHQASAQRQLTAATSRLSGITWTTRGPSTTTECLQRHRGEPEHLADLRTVTATYDTIGGSYQDQEDGFKRTGVYVGSSTRPTVSRRRSTRTTLYGQGSTVSYPVDTTATKPRFLERDGVDLDELNEDLKTTRSSASIYPQARLGSGAANLHDRRWCQ
jgi:hypothetical protein